MSDFYIGQGDTASPFIVVARDAAGAAVNIQNATVHLDIMPIRGGTAIVNGAALNLQVTDGSDGSKGTMGYGQGAAPWGSATTTAGDFLAKWTVTFSGGAVQSFPNDGFLLVTIGPDAPTGTTGPYVSQMELTKTMQLLGTTFAEQDLARAVGAAARSIDNYCGRTFQAHVGAATVRKYTALSDKWITVHDLQSIPTSVVVNGGIPLVVDTDYYLDAVPVAYPGPPYGALRKILQGFSPSTPQGVAITATWGWPAVPEPITEAAGIIAARLLRRAREAPFGILPFGDQGEAMRLTQADPDVKFLLQPYRRLDLYQ